MRELRLLPAAFLLWGVVLSVLLSRELWVATALTLAAAVVAGLYKEAGQAVFLGAVGAAGGLVARYRVHQAQSFEFPAEFHGVVESVKVLDGGVAFLRLQVEGYPAAVPVMVHSGAEVAPASQILVAGRVVGSDRPGVGEVLITTSSVEVTQQPQGYAAWVNQVRDCFSEAVQDHVGPSSQGLLPGMVLGDTRLQTAVEEQTYIDTGLSHLSAVSGSNVSIVTVSVMVLLAALTLSPRMQLAGAAGALLVFVTLVGTEPSVLRAAVTGTVGLLAVFNSRRMEPIHGLCLAVIGLLLWDSDLAVQYGFILSVTATAGIVMLFPLLYQALARTRWPDVFIRALAVAIAADVVTMPIIAVMAGRVSLVAVLANVLAAPAVAPVTLLGLIAVILTLLPGGLEILPLRLVEPCTWWIHQVGTYCQNLPLATVDTGTGGLSLIWVLTGCCWIIIGVYLGLVRIMAAVFLLLLGLQWYNNRLPPVVELSELNYIVVDKLPEETPPGTTLIIITDPTGEPADRPTTTPAGTPVLYPHRDGEVQLHTDGTQHAADGRF